MGENDKISKMIAYRMQQERKNDQRRLHKNKIERDRLLIQTRYIEWSKSICANDHAAGKIAFVRRLEKLYERRQEIDELRRAGQVGGVRVRTARSRRSPLQPLDDPTPGNTDAPKSRATSAKSPLRRRKSLIPGGLKAGKRPGTAAPGGAAGMGMGGKGVTAAAGSGSAGGGVGKEMEEEETKKKESYHHQRHKHKKEQALNKVNSLSGGYRDNDPPQSFYKRKGITPPEKLLSQWLSTHSNYGQQHQPEHQTSIYAKLMPIATINQSPTENDKNNNFYSQKQQQQRSENSKATDEVQRRSVIMSAPSSDQKQAAPAHQKKLAPGGRENQEEEELRPKTAVTFSKNEEEEKKPRRRKTIPSPHQRPHTAAGRLFTSSSTHLSEAEQDYVRRRIRQKSAGMRSERDRSLTSQHHRQQQQLRAPYRCRSSLVRSEGRKFVEYVAGCKQADVDGGVPDVQVQAKRLLMSATLEYQKCLEQDVGQFIVDVQF